MRYEPFVPDSRGTGISHLSRTIKQNHLTAPPRLTQMQDSSECRAEAPTQVNRGPPHRRQACPETAQSNAGRGSSGHCVERVGRVRVGRRCGQRNPSSSRRSNDNSHDEEQIGATAVLRRPPRGSPRCNLPLEKCPLTSGEYAVCSQSNARWCGIRAL